MTNVCNIFFEAPENQTSQIVSTDENRVSVTSLFRASPSSTNVKFTELGGRGTGKDEQARDNLEIPGVCKYGGVHINGTCHIKPPASTVEAYPTNVCNSGQQMDAPKTSPRTLAETSGELKKNHFQHFSANRLSPTALMIRRAKTLKDFPKLKDDSCPRKSQPLGMGNRGITTNELVINLRQRYPATHRLTCLEKDGKLPRIAFASPNKYESPKVSFSTDKISSVINRSSPNRMETIKRESEKDLTPLMKLLRQQLAERFQEALARKSICKSSLNSFVSMEPEKKNEFELSLAKDISEHQDPIQTVSDIQQPKTVRSEIELTSDAGTVKVQSFGTPETDQNVTSKGSESNDVITTIRVRSPKHFTTSVTKSEDFSGTTHVVNYDVEIDVDEGSVNSLQEDEKDFNLGLGKEVFLEDEKTKVRKKSSGLNEPVGILRSPTNFDLKVASQRNVSFAIDLEHIRVMSPRPCFAHDSTVKSTNSISKSKRKSKLTK